jgi:hypothetical protein
VSKPALTILPLIPAPSKRPNTVRRNKVTTSWSRGESRSGDMHANHQFSCSLNRVALMVGPTYGSSAPLHLPLFQWPYPGPCHPERPLRRFADSGSDTTASCMRGMAWKGCPGCPGGGWWNFFQSIYLSHSNEHKTQQVNFFFVRRYPHLQKLVASHLLSAATVGS